MPIFFSSRAAEKKKAQREEAAKYVRAFANIKDDDVDSGLSLAVRLASDLRQKIVLAEDLSALTTRLHGLGKKVHEDDGPLKAFTGVFKTIKKEFDEAVPQNKDDPKTKTIPLNL